MTSTSSARKWHACSRRRDMHCNSVGRRCGVKRPTRTAHPTHARALPLHLRYRRLALKYHPDINKEDTARAEFERVCEAYEVLSERECAYFALVGGGCAREERA